MARQIVVDILGDSSGFNSAVDKAEGAGGRFKNVMSGIGLGIGTAAFSLLDTGISQVIGTLGEADAAFKEDQASQSLLKTALANNIDGWDGNTDAIEANISAQQAKGVSDSMQREGMVTLLNKTHDITAAQQLNNAAIELAAGTGKTYQEAIDEITSGLNGRAAALAKDGIAITKNGTAADLAASIMDKYKGSQDALAETSEGKTKVSQEKVGEAMEKVGAIVDKVATVALPILADAFSTVVDIVMDVVAAIQPVIDAVMPHLAAAAQFVGGVFNTVFPAVRTVVETVFNGIQLAVGVLQGVFNAVFPAIRGTVETVFGAIGTVIGVFQTALHTAGDVVGSVVGAMKDVFGGLQSFVGGIFNGVVGIIRGALNIVVDAMNTAIDGINAIPDLDVGDVHIGIPHLDHLPRLHSGGIVPGIRGTEVPIMALAGERVSPIGSGGDTTVVTLNATFNVSGQQDPEQFSQRTLLTLQRELRRNGITLGA